MMLVDAPGLTCSRVCSLDGGAAVRHFWSVWIWIFTYSKPDSVGARYTAAVPTRYGAVSRLPQSFWIWIGRRIGCARLILQVPLFRLHSRSGLARSCTPRPIMLRRGLGERVWLISDPTSRKSRAPQGVKPALSRAGAKSRVEADRGPATHRASTSQGAARTTGGSLMITLLRVRRQSCPCIGAHHWLARSLMSKRCGGNVLRYANGLARSVDLRA